jgi:sugar phosphate permease
MYIGIGLLFTFYIFLPRNSKEIQNYGDKEITNKHRNFCYHFRYKIKYLFLLFSHKHIVIYSIIAIGLYAPLAVLADLWGSLFLHNRFALTTQDATNVSLILYLGLAIGSLILPLFCNNLHRINITLVTSCFFLMILFIILLILDEKNILLVSKNKIFLISMILLAVGFFAGAEMMCFSAAVHYVGILWTTQNKTNNNKKQTKTK